MDLIVLGIVICLIGIFCLVVIFKLVLDMFRILNIQERLIDRELKNE